MLVQGQDFVCDTSHGIMLCAGLTPEATSTYKVLQLQLARLLPQLPKGPEIKIVVDGVIGPSVALAVQTIVTRISQGYPNILQELGQLIYAPAEQAIAGVAQNADVLGAYLDKILTQDPNAVRSPPPLKGPEPESPTAFMKRVFTKKRVLAGVATVASLAGLAAVVSASDARALGKVDRSRFLPESDGTDAMDDDEYESDDDDAIDVESVEVIEPARERELFTLPSPEA